MNNVLQFQQLLRLSNFPDENKNVDFLSNKTQHNYINLRGANNSNTIDSVHQFLCQNGVWNCNDEVILVKKPIEFIPPASNHNISFVLNFYKKACLAKEARDRKLINEPISQPIVEKETKEKKEEKEDHELHYSPPHIQVKSLLNSNIAHNQKKNNVKFEEMIDEDNSLDDTIKLVQSDIDQSSSKDESSESFETSVSTNVSISDESNSENIKSLSEKSPVNILKNTKIILTTKKTVAKSESSDDSDIEKTVSVSVSEESSSEKLPKNKPIAKAKTTPKPKAPVKAKPVAKAKTIAKPKPVNTKLETKTAPKAKPGPKAKAKAKAGTKKKN